MARDVDARAECIEPEHQSCCRQQLAALARRQDPIEEQQHVCRTGEGEAVEGRRIDRNGQHRPPAADEGDGRTPQKSWNTSVLTACHFPSRHRQRALRD
ncbi:MAG: hypothetical protein WDN31_01295 [Hyphomicrobium sp.]